MQLLDSLLRAFLSPSSGHMRRFPPGLDFGWLFAFSERCLVHEPLVSPRKMRNFLRGMQHEKCEIFNKNVEFSIDTKYLARNVMNPMEHANPKKINTGLWSVYSHANSHLRYTRPSLSIYILHRAFFSHLHQQCPTIHSRHCWRENPRFSQIRVTPNTGLWQGDRRKYITARFSDQLWQLNLVS